MSARRSWVPILVRADEIVRSYSTPVTLRQLHYRLVMDPSLDYHNTEGDYKQLSARTAELRRAGEFPSLADLTRGIERELSYRSVDEAVQRALAIFRLDRSLGQDPLPFVVVEKATLTAQVRSWVTGKTIPVVALRGYSSETLDSAIERFVSWEKRSVRLIYIGDLDPEGEDIERNVQAQTGLVTERIAVTPKQVTLYGLPEEPGKPSSSRAPGFIAKYGRLFQIEVEALDPDVLRGLVQDAIAETWDDELERVVLVEEERQRERFQEFVDGFGEE